MAMRIVQVKSAGKTEWFTTLPEAKKAAKASSGAVRELELDKSKEGIMAFLNKECAGA